MKRLLVFLLFIALIVSFSFGCGKKEAPETESTAVEEPAESVAEEIDTTAMEVDTTAAEEMGTESDPGDN